MTMKLVKLTVNKTVRVTARLSNERCFSIVEGPVSLCLAGAVVITSRSGKWPDL